jgi:peptidoglycan-N-acetylglucosamine deacetylase
MARLALVGIGRSWENACEMSGIVTAAEWTAKAAHAGTLVARMPGGGAVTAGAVALAAAGTLAWGAVAPSSQLYGRTICRLGSGAGGSTGKEDGGRRRIALTFDDGPNPAVTPRLLELLERYEAHATFFVIGRYARECPALVGEIASAGHSIGNHTDSHPDLLWMTPSAIRRELAACRDAVIRATGSAPRWMRPPYGFRGPQVAQVVRETGHEAMVT